MTAPNRPPPAHQRHRHNQVIVLTGSGEARMAARAEAHLEGRQLPHERRGVPQAARPRRQQRPARRGIFTTLLKSGPKAKISFVFLISDIAGTAYLTALLSSDASQLPN